jgi:hypothetical protein
MATDQPMTNTHSDADFQVILNELTSIKDKYVVEQLNWYKTHSMQPMLFFRISGILLIFLSVSIPLLTTLEGLWRTIVLPGVALLVAGLTGLISFYRWESDWKGYRQAQFTLEYLITAWELRIEEAKLEKDTQQAINMAMEATQQLLDATHTVTSSETQEFFQRVQVPRVQQGQ